jgi:hypothetical protein
LKFINREKEAAMKKIAWGLLLCVSLLGLVSRPTSGQTCTTQTRRVTGYANGDQSTLSTMNGIVIDPSGLYLRLRNKGANFAVSGGYSVSGYNRQTGAAADFNGDGLADLVEGGFAYDYNTNSSLGNTNSGDSNLAMFLSHGADPGNPSRFLFTGPYYVLYGFAGNPLYATYKINALGTGDFDRDGDVDIAALTWQGRLFIFWNRFKENHQAAGSIPIIDTTPTYIADLINDGYTEWGQGGSHQRWDGDIECQDVDGDGDLDLIVGVPQRYAGSRWGEVVVYFNNGTGIFSRLPNIYNPFPYNTDNYLTGVTGVAAADFDGDGDIDFIAGSAGGPSFTPTTLYFYKNDGLGRFTLDSTRTMTYPASRGGVSALRGADLDGDGKPDVVLSTDGAHDGQMLGGYLYWYKNDGTGHFTIASIPSSGAQLSSSGDLDSGAVGDFDGDGDLDIFVADGNNSLNCYFVMNQTYLTYVPSGTVDSKSLVGCSFITSNDAVVSATIHVVENKPAQTSIVYYLSNSDDQNGNPLWEGPVTPDVLFTFQNPGDFLRWRAVFTSSNDRVTPRVISLYIDYNYITKREYSRTSHAAIKVDYDPARSGDEEVLYSASFEFPKWRGHLRSWDVTTLNLSPNRGSVLKDILAANAQPIADAGTLLASRPSSSRIVYTAYDQQADGVMNDRVDFTQSQSTILENYLQLGIGSPEVPLLIDFVLGAGRTWKLGDINHSSPKALMPPSGIASVMGTGYDSFKLANANRRKLILAGANDGMLHAFDAVTMDEAWAFIPNNLLYKLKNMKVTDPDCGVYLYHHFFVDGTATIKDVYFGGNWHTVLVTGQGSGWGKNHDWYYFALDITDPVAPRPLWEVTDPFMGETWSVPAVVKIASSNKWVALFGSGYDNDGDPNTNIGHYFYCVDIETGAILNSFQIKESPEPASPFGIQNTLPGSPETVDITQDGIADAVYFGDLIGRVWKIDLTGNVSSWSPKVIYRDPNKYPIITKPAVYVDTASSNTVHVYVGTGGDDRAPATGNYSFVALLDGTTSATVEWYLGPAALATQLGINPLTMKTSFVQGEKVWADPVIANREVFIATLEGNIESMNPCNTLAGAGRIYARYLLGNQSGGTALQSALGAPLEYLQTEQKVRSAVTLGETQLVSNQGQNTNMRKVFIQSYTQPAGGIGPEPPSQVLAQPIISTGLVIKQWREIYKVFKR